MPTITPFSVGSVQTLVDAATITLDLASQNGFGNSFAVTLGGNRTLNVLNQGDGQALRLFVTQDGTGSRTLAIQNDGTAALVSGTLSTTAGAVDMLEIVYRADLGKSFVTVVAKNYA